MRPEQIWQAALGELQLQLAKSTFDTTLRGAEFLSHKDGVFTIGVENVYAKDWLENRLLSTIKRTLAGIAGRPVEEVRFVVQEEDTGTPIAAPAQTLSPEAAWPAAVTELERAHPGFNDGSLRCLQFLECEPNADESLTFVIGLDSVHDERRVKDAIGVLLNALTSFSGRPAEIEFVLLTEPPDTDFPTPQVYNLPLRYLNAAVHDLDPRSPVMTNKAILDYDRAVKRAFKSRTNAERYTRRRQGKADCVSLPDRNLIICGPPGTGKTHTAAAIGLSAAAQGFEAVFVGVKELIDALYADIRTRGDTGRRLLERAKDCDLLILDDLNAGRLDSDQSDASTRSPEAGVSPLARSEWAAGEVRELIHARYHSRRNAAPLIVTSNQTADELQVSALDDATISRLLGGAAIAELPRDAVDYRYYSYLTPGQSNDASTPRRDQNAQALLCD